MQRFALTRNKRASRTGKRGEFKMRHTNLIKKKGKMFSLAIINCFALLMLMSFISPSNAAPDGISEWRVISEAYSWVGVPYKLGGESRAGIDCSGLVRQVYIRASGGLAYYYDRTAQQIAIVSRPVSPQRPGDVIIFKPKNPNGQWHVGIYISYVYRNGRWDFCFIHASAYAKKVVVDYLYDSPYYGKDWWLNNYYVWFARYNPDYWIA
jgi:cell wall-associated NlpC family hydrolase